MLYENPWIIFYQMGIEGSGRLGGRWKEGGEEKVVGGNFK